MGWQKWLSSNVMAAQLILNSFGLMVTQKPEDLEFINVLSVDAPAQRT